jgi:2-iminoacetate synthase ThiH
MTVVVQVGNSDNKLTQVQWSRFVRDVRQIVKEFATRVFFQGGSSWDAPWQNACWVFECYDEHLFEEFKQELAVCRDSYRQEAVAVLSGYTDFI